MWYLTVYHQRRKSNQSTYAYISDSFFFCGGGRLGRVQVVFRVILHSNFSFMNRVHQRGRSLQNVTLVVIDFVNNRSTGKPS